MELTDFMKKILITMLLAGVMPLFAASPTFQSFDTNTFISSATANTVQANTNPANVMALANQGQVASAQSTALAAIVVTNTAIRATLTQASNTLLVDIAVKADTNSPTIWNANIQSGTGAYLTNLPPSGISWQLAPTPPIGFSSYGDYGCTPTEQGVTNQILSMVTNGLVASGYNWYWIEDGAYSNATDTAGNLVASTNFPRGFGWLTAWAHSQGVKIGSYISWGVPSCCQAGNPGTSDANLERHVGQQVDWGFDGLIIDECGNGAMIVTNPPSFFNMLRRVQNVAWNRNQVSTNALDQAPYGASANRGMVIMATANGQTATFYGNTAPSEIIYEANAMGWGAIVTRTQDVPWASKELKVLTSFGFAVGPGHWLDSPWSLSLNNTPQQLRLMLSVDAILAAHERWGLYNANPQAVSMLENKEVLSVFNDPAGVCGHYVSSNSLVEQFQRPLGAKVSDTNAILLLNWSNALQTVTVYATNFGLSSLKSWKVRDVFQHTTLTNFVGSFPVDVNATNAMLVVVSPSDFNGTSLPAALGYPANYATLWNSNGTVFPVVNNDAGDRWTVGNSQNTASFDPSQISGLALRYYPNELQQVPGTKINALGDRSGYARSLYLKYTAGVPVMTNSSTEIQGKSYANFDGYSGLTNAVRLPQPVTFFAVMTLPYATNINTKFDPILGDAWATWWVGTYPESDGSGQFPGRLRLFTSDTTAYLYTGFLDQFTNKFMVCEIIVNGASSDIKTNLVSAKAGTIGTPGTMTLTNLGVGCTAQYGDTVNDAAGAAKFKLAYLLAYTNATLTLAQETNVFQWLTNRFF